VTGYPCAYGDAASPTHRLGPSAPQAVRHAGGFRRMQPTVRHLASAPTLDAITA